METILKKETVLKKWGNSAAIRLPAYVIKESKLRLNQSVLIIVKSGRIIIGPREKPKRYSLSTLLAGITENNRHDEVNFGPPVGKEML